MYIYYDPGSPEWFSCGRCGLAGHGMTILQQVWKTDLAGAMARLRDIGLVAVSDAGLDFAARHVPRKSEYERLLNTTVQDFDLASGFLPNQSPNIVPPAWKKLLRVGNRQAFAAVYKGHTQRIATIPKAWKEFGVLPLESFPGRPAGLLAVRDDVVNLVCPPERKDTVTFGLAIAIDVSVDFMVVSDSIEEAFRLQVTGLRETGRFMPLCGMRHQGEIFPVWTQLRHNLVFWGKEATAGLFREAASCNGLCVVRSKLPSAHTVAARLRALVGYAKPWAAALHDHLQEIKPDRIRHFVLSLGLNAAEMETLFDLSTGRVRDTLEPLMETPGDMIRLGNFEVFRRNNEWFARDATDYYHNRTETERIEQITDFVMLFHKVTEMPRAIYKGEIRCRNKIFQFEADSADIDPDPVLWLRQQFWRRGLKPPFVHQNWRHGIMQLASEFGQAEYVAAPTSVGWSAEHDGISTANWLLGRNGALKEWPIAYPSPPGRLNFPGAITQDAVRAVSEVSGAAAFWTVLAHVAGSLLSPITSQTPKDLLLMGQGAREIGAMTARLAGCCSLSSKLVASSADALKQLQESAKARWPVLLLTDAKSGRIPELFVDHEDLRSIYRPDSDLRGIEFFIRHACDVLDINETVGTTEALRQFGGDLLPAYLMDVSKRNFQFKLTEDVTASVLSDMRRWWVGLGGTANMQSRLRTGPNATRHMLHRLLILCRSKLAAFPLGFGDFLEPHKIPIETDARFMYFSPRRFEEAMAWRVQLDMTKFGQQLHEAGLLRNPDAKVWALPLKLWMNVVRSVTRTRRLGNSDATEPSTTADAGTPTGASP